MRQALSRINIFRRSGAASKATAVAASLPAATEAEEKRMLDCAIRDIALLAVPPSACPSPSPSPSASVSVSHPLHTLLASMKPHLTMTNYTPASVTASQPISSSAVAAVATAASISEQFKYLHEVIERELEECKGKMNNTIQIGEESESSAAVDAVGGSSSSVVERSTLLMSSSYNENKEMLFRLMLSRHYFRALEEILQNNQYRYPFGLLSSSDDVFDAQKLCGLVECLFVGTSSDRVQKHMQLFGKEMDQETLQACFYPLYEAEIESARQLLQLYPLSLKRHEKKIKKMTNGYLLDTLELNTKIRCIMAWSDPNHKRGYAPVSDDLKLPIDILVKGRTDFFNEGETMGKAYLTSVKGVINEYYEKKKDNRELMRNGAIFFILTCVGDYVVCSI